MKMVSYKQKIRRPENKCHHYSSPNLPHRKSYLQVIILKLLINITYPLNRV